MIPDAFYGTSNNSFSVTPAQAGVQKVQYIIDSRFRGNNIQPKLQIIGENYTTCLLKKITSAISIYRSGGQFHSGIQGIGEKQNAEQDAVVAKILKAIAGKKGNERFYRNCCNNKRHSAADKK